jgi:hypothetical protein
MVLCWTRTKAIENDYAVDRGGLEPPTSPSLDLFAKGLDDFSVSYQTRLPARVLATLVPSL